LDFVVRPGQRARARRIRYVPTWVRHPDYTVMRATPGSPSWNRTVSAAGRGRRVGPVRPRECQRMQIGAAVLEEFANPLVVQDVELEGPKPGEVLVRLAACGVCH